MEKNATPLVDEHLQSILGMQEANTDDFFYTRLKAKMEKGKSQQGWGFPLKPAWVVGTLSLLLAVNGFMLAQNFKAKNTSASATSTTLQGFAESYDQTISLSY